MGYINIKSMLVMLIYWVKTYMPYKKITEAALDSSKEVGLEINSETTKYMSYY
jgi:hypothetical protein